MTPEELGLLVEAGDLNAVRRAVDEEPALVRAVAWARYEPLHIASWQKHIEVVQLLLARGADVNAGGKRGRRPLHYAVHEGGSDSTEVVEVLLASRADPSLLDDRGWSALDWALKQADRGLSASIKLMRRYMQK